MSPSLLGLPPAPQELKAIVPFLQRADELKKQDSIISYWCAYYAAQVGISIKARDNLSRDFLFRLLGVLEKMKADIGPHDAVDIEGVSFAYVENFALKVFVNADNEDRNNRATRSTAKKFLAAANFLEVLKTFPKTAVSDSTEEKIRYAKWKAADIAKAFREGRNPAPGPPGWEEEQEQLKGLQREQEEPSIFAQTGPQDPISPFHAANQRISPPCISHHDNASSFQNIRDNQSPLHPHDRSGSGAHTIDAFSGSARGHLKKTAWTNEELEGKFTPTPTASPKKSSLKSGSPDSDKRVRFSPSQNGARPLVPSPPKEYSGPESIYGPTLQPRMPDSSIVIPFHGIAGYPPVPPPPPSNPVGTYIYAPSQPPRVSPPRGYPTAPSISSQAEVFELTPEIIAKAQKRCRYAISALDYEDVETARKELRAALALLES